MLPEFRSRLRMRFDATGHARLKAEEGSNLVEFAFIVLLLMAMMLGIIDFSRALYSYHFVSNAAREATRYAAVRGYTCTNDGSCVNDGNCTSYATTTCVPTYVGSITPQGIDATAITTTAAWPAHANGPTICKNAVGGVGPYPNYPGCTVEVTVSYNFSFIFPLVYKPFSSTGTITLSSTSEMIVVH
jgi:Flp pilus assembly protein TadG